MDIFIVDQNWNADNKLFYFLSPTKVGVIEWQKSWYVEYFFLQIKFGS